MNDGWLVAGRCTPYSDSVGGAVWLVQITENGKRKTENGCCWLEGRVKGGGEHGRERERQMARFQCSVWECSVLCTLYVLVRLARSDD